MNHLSALSYTNELQTFKNSPVLWLTLYFCVHRHAFTDVSLSLLNSWVIHLTPLAKTDPLPACGPTFRCFKDFDLLL